MTPRLKWSVVIPTWNRTDYLDQCLLSVLGQCPGPDQMEVVVRDNASDRVDVEAVVRSVSGASIQFHRNECNVGFVGNANLCIADANGELTHLLSDDDYVLAGFYRHIEELAARYPDAAAYAVGCMKVDGSGLETGRMCLPDGLWQGKEGMSHMLNGNPFQMPGVVVRRSFYERCGGFNPELVFNADWDVWLRAANNGGIATSSRILAAYRVHGNNDTARLTATSSALKNTVLFLDRLQAAYPGTDWTPFQDFLRSLAKNQLGALSRNKAYREYIKGLGSVVPALGMARSSALLAGEIVRPVRAISRKLRS